ncbi:hypothetical protein [Halobacillus salinus]|uniref:hypothetical protein n=1 Tax=Halobacillus salinus TaxID=192814 RepID=UPI0009A6CB71|nr:hypothetical protein [Halobacillus salinus]
MTEFKELLSIFSLPVTILPLILLLIKLAPISHLTADSVENAMFSKEKRWIIRTVKYIYRSLQFTIILFAMSTIISETGLYKWILYSGEGIFAFLIIFAEFIFFYFVIVNDENIKKKIKNKIVYIFVIKLINKNESVFNNVLLVSFITIILLTYSFILAITDAELNIFSTRGFLIKLSVAFILSLTIYPLVQPGLILNKWMNVKRESTFIKEGNEIWYILHPIGKEKVLLGDGKSPDSCEKKKIMQTESLVGKTIYIEKD